MQSNEVLELAAEIKPILAGKDPEVISAVLAELLSLLLAGFVVPGDSEQTISVRSGLLASHCQLVRQLTIVNAKILGTDQ
jgi:hypothetical protein